jgi:hypothetical protein
MGLARGRSRAGPRLPCDGLSNPGIGIQLFIGPRAFKDHLGKAFVKLDSAQAACVSAFCRAPSPRVSPRFRTDHSDCPLADASTGRHEQTHRHGISRAAHLQLSGATHEQLVERPNPPAATPRPDAPFLTRPPTIFDFNRLRRGGAASAVGIAASIFLDIFNVFLLLLQLFGGGRD